VDTLDINPIHQDGQWSERTKVDDTIYVSSYGLKDGFKLTTASGTSYHMEHWRVK